MKHSVSYYSELYMVFIAILRALKNHASMREILQIGLLKVLPLK